MCSEVKVWHRPSSPAQWLHEKAKKKQSENLHLIEIAAMLPCRMRAARAAWKLLAVGDHHIYEALTLFGGQRVLFFCLRLLQLCLVKTSDFSHVGLVRHFACDRGKLRKRHLSSGALARI